MDTLIFIALLIFSAIMFQRSIKLLLHPEEHVRRTMQKLDQRQREGLKEMPPAGPIRVIGWIGAGATGTATGFLASILWQHLT